MPSSGMLHRVSLVRIDVSEERIASITRITRIGELGTTLAVTSNRSSVGITGVTRRNIPENGIHHSRRRENLSINRLSSVVET
jgi:hypothetical protein